MESGQLPNLGHVLNLKVSAVHYCNNELYRCNIQIGNAQCHLSLKVAPTIGRTPVFQAPTLKWPTHAEQLENLPRLTQMEALHITLHRVSRVNGNRIGTPLQYLKRPTVGIIFTKKQITALSVQVDQMPWARGPCIFPWAKAWMEWDTCSILGKCYLHLPTRPLLYRRQGQDRVFSHLSRQWRIWLPNKLASLYQRWLCSTLSSCCVLKIMNLQIPFALLHLQSREVENEFGIDKTTTEQKLGTLLLLFI